MQIWEALVLIVMIGAIASVIRARNSVGRDGNCNTVHHHPASETNPDADRLRDEVKTLKDRIAVLERLATDTNRAVDLDREIDRLR